MEINQTIIIIAVTCLVTYMAWQNKQLMERLIFWSPAIKEGQVERFVTHGFIHADGTHLLFNMFTFYFFGSIIESFYRQYFGGAGYVIFYLAAIVVAMLPSYFKHKDDRNYMSLGASGAVSACCIYSEPYRYRRSYLQWLMCGTAFMPAKKIMTTSITALIYMVVCLVSL